MNNISKFLNLRSLKEHSVLLDYKTFNPEKTIIFDVDKTILFAPNRDYENAIPYIDMRDKINELHSDGWTIILFTARGQLSKNGNMKLIEKLNRPVLEKWLELHEYHYDHLLFCKPFGQWYVDDKSMTPKEFLDHDFN